MSKSAVAKHVSFLILLNGNADSAPFRVAEPQPVALVLKEEELTAAHWPAPLQLQLAVCRVVPVALEPVMVGTLGLPTIAQGPCEALPKSLHDIHIHTLGVFAKMQKWYTTSKCGQAPLSGVQL